MHRFPGRILVTLAAALAAAPEARAQREPHVGYIYPAGGASGAEIEVTVGGQYLDGVATVHVSGGGLQAAVLDHTKPLTPKEVNDLRQKLGELQKLLGDRQKGGRKGENPAIRTLAKELGLAGTRPKDIADLRKKLAEAQQRLNPQIAEKVLLKINIAADAAPGEREVRLVAAGGVTNSIRFVVGSWPEYREEEPNDTRVDRDVPGELPFVINGQIMPGDVDRFRFRARKGTRLVATASARSLIPYLADAVPGWFQATLALYGATGDEVAYDDDFRFQPDPVLLYEVPADGSYVLEINDAIYRGREDFVYRIALGELPVVTSMFPLGGRAGERTTVALTGWNLPAAELPVDVPADAHGILSVPIGSEGRGLLRVQLAVDGLPECVEREPTDAPEAAQAIELPLIVNGRIDPRGDEDVFRFEGRAGDEVVAEVLARRLGSPLDSLLVLADASGRVLASNDDSEDPGAGLLTHHADSFVFVRLPADGTHYVRVVDAQRQGDAACGYRLRVSPPRPDFELRVVPSSLNVRAGTIVPVTVHALRRDGFSGDIALALKDAPGGFMLGGAWVPAGHDRVRVTLTAPPAGREGPFALRMEGRAIVEGRDVCRPAVPAEDMMQAFFYRHLVPSSEWLVAVRGRGNAGVGVRVVGDTPVRLAPGGTARVRIAAPRGRLGKQVELELSEPPEGIALEGVSTDRDGMEVVLRAEGGKAKVGLKGNLIVAAFVMRDVTPRDGKGKAGKRRTPVGTLPAIPFEVVNP